MTAKVVARCASLLVAAALLAACSGSGSTASASPSSGPPTSGAPLGFLPAGCHPSIFRDPSGKIIDLNGRWADAEPGSPLVKSPPKGAGWSGDWIRQAGDCLWGVNYFDPTEPGLGPDFWSWSATLQTSLDFKITSVNVTGRDPTDIVAVGYGRVAFDSAGEPIICWSPSADVLAHCPDRLGPNDTISYRVDTISGNP